MVAGSRSEGVTFIEPQVSVRDVVLAIDAFAPPELAMEGDHVGLQVGRLEKPARKVWLALDPSPGVIEQAAGANVDLLVTHHAMLFRPVNRIDLSTARGGAIATALRHDLTVYTAHTNLDITDGGVNDVLADLFGLTNVEVLDPIHSERLLKLVVFVPVSHLETVRRAICEAGAGQMGGYRDCTFSSTGEGTFLPDAGASPFIGEVGRLERVSEVRLETILHAHQTQSVIQSMLAAHPYEEVAYDLYPLELTGRVHGLGRIGSLRKPMSLKAFTDKVRTALKLPHIRFAGEETATLTRVAVLGGSGGKWVHRAIHLGAQVLVTSDCDHHTMAEAWQDGLAIIDATHAAMETPVLHKLQAHIRQAFGDTVDVSVVEMNEDPIHWL